jgi:hypothetical protein
MSVDAILAKPTGVYFFYLFGRNFKHISTQPHFLEWFNFALGATRMPKFASLVFAVVAKLTFGVLGVFGLNMGEYAFFSI